MAATYGLSTILGIFCIPKRLLRSVWLIANSVARNVGIWIFRRWVWGFLQVFALGWLPVFTTPELLIEFLRPLLTRDSTNIDHCPKKSYPKLWESESRL